MQEPVLFSLLSGLLPMQKLYSPASSSFLLTMKRTTVNLLLHYCSTLVDTAFKSNANCWKQEKLRWNHIQT